MPTLKKTHGRHLMVLIAMCGLMATSLGFVTNTAGIFFGPIAADFGLGDRITPVSLALTISNLIYALSGMLVARVVNAWSFRPLVIASASVLVATTAALSLCRSLAALYALNAVRGFSAGMISNVLVTMVIGEWFRSDTGLISSLALGFSGVAGALFNPILEAVIRGSGWRTAYLAAAGIMLAFNLPAMALPIGLKPQDAGLEPMNVAGSGARAAKRPRRSRDARSLAALLLAVGVISAMSFICAMPQLFKAIAATYGHEPTGVAMMSVVLAVNTGGKLVFGAMTDRLGARRSMLIYGAGIAAGILTLWLLRVPAAMLASAVLIGLCYSIPTVGAVMICRELFSPERYAKVFPKINFGSSLANAAGYPLLSAIHGATGSYDGALMLALMLVLAAMAAVAVVYRLADREAARG